MIRAFALAPCGADARAAVVNRACRHSVSKCEETDLLKGASELAARPVDLSSVAVLASFGARPHPRSTARTAVPSANARPTGHARSLPCQLEPLLPDSQAHNRSIQLPLDAANAVLSTHHLTPHFRYLHSLSAETRVKIYS